MSKVNYLVKRLCKQKGVNELVIDEMTIDQLLDAFMGDGEAPAVPQITINPRLRVKPMPTIYANLLKAGKTVVINDPNDFRTYYVTAYEGELIAVFQPMGPWYETYSARCTNQQVLIELGIIANSFKDHRILDGIFQFPLEGPGIPVIAQPELMDVPPTTDQKWFPPVGRKVTRKEQSEMVHQAQADMGEAIENLVEAASKIAEAGESLDVDEVLETQMSRAMQKFQRGQKKVATVGNDAIIIPPTYGEVRRDRAPTA